MRIGILGPIATDSVAQLLPALPPRTPRGVTSAPLLGTLIQSLLDLGHEVVAYTLVSNEVLSATLCRLGGGRFTLVQCQGRAHSFRFNDGQPGRALDGFRVERQRLVEAMAMDRLDVVHAHWLYEYAAAALDQSKAPVVVTSHDEPWKVLRHMPSLFRLSRFLIARRVLRSDASLTAVSPYLAQSMARFGSPEVTAVANPLPCELLAGGLRKSACGAHGRRLGMVVNGWSKLKNGAMALRAFGRLRLERPDVVLELYGEDFQPDGLAQRWALQHGLDSGVKFVGPLPRPELLRSMASLDALVHPSHEESFGLVLAEAMALGVPVVGGLRSGAVPWLLLDGRAGLLVDVRSEQALCTAMNEVLSGDAEVSRRAALARERVAALCSPEAVARSYESVYLRAMHRRAAGAALGAMARVES